VKRGHRLYRMLDGTNNFVSLSTIGLLYELNKTIFWIRLFEKGIGMHYDYTIIPYLFSDIRLNQAL